MAGCPGSSNSNPTPSVVNSGNGSSPQNQTSQAPPKPTYVLVVDKMEVRETPQSGTWLMCFKAFAPDGVESIFHIPNKEYEGDGIVIDFENNDHSRVELYDVTPGTEIRWWLGLDDDEADACSDAEDRTSGTLIAKSRGAASFHPAGDWDFTLHWHIDER